jgi:hypothetical protein
MNLLIELPDIVAIAFEVIAGKWGNGEERKNRLEMSGYNSETIQSCVNELMALLKKYGGVF